MAFMEPHEKVWRGESGKYFTLSELRSKSDTVAPFEGVCGFSSSLATYSGTIFRFPLRNVVSDLSDRLYDLDKLKELSGALKCEGMNLLLFLRSVDTVEVYEKDATGQEFLKFQTSIANEERETVYANRKAFLQKVELEHKDSNSGIKDCISLTLDVNITMLDEKGATTHRWIVASQVGSSNNEVLQCASRNHVLPWVGTAIETGGLQNQSNVTKEGRVFCFLPMPTEANSPLPIYVNGTFGPTDDRRTLKWQSSERQNDVAAEWNKILVTDVVPPCYALLIRYATDQLRMPHTQIYNMWPDVEAVKGTEWEPLLTSLFNILITNNSIVWAGVPTSVARQGDCTSVARQGDWISVDKATFVQQNDKLSQLSQVHSSLHHCGVKLVEVPAIIHSALKSVRCPVNSLTPHLAREKLKSNPNCYESADNAKKIELLKYCLSDNKYDSLTGLKLLPLENNSFTAFQEKESRDPIYICNSDFPKELFPNKDHFIVSSQHADVLNKVASSNQTQVQLMDLPSAVRLIKQCFPSQWQHLQQVTNSLFPAVWFTTFWKWVQHYDLKDFDEDMVVPLSRESASCANVTRLSLTSSVLYLTDLDMDRDKKLLSAIQKLPLKITSTQAHPHLRHGQLFAYLHKLTPDGILDALSNSCNSQFSQLHGINFTSEEAHQLCVLLSQLTQLPHHRYQVLLNLPIFSSLNQSSLCNAFTSAQASWGKKAVLQPQELSLSVQHLPDSLVVFLPLLHQLPLLKLLSDHVQAPTAMQFVTNILLPMISQDAYKPLSNMDDIMSEIIIQLPTWRHHYPHDISALQRSLQDLPFLPIDDNVHSTRHCPKDLYDPSSEELSALFQGELVFPCAPFNEESHLSSLKGCGLMSEVSPQALLNIIASIGLPSSAVPQRVDPVKYNRAKAVLNYIENHPFPNEAQLIQVTKSYSWLPISSTPPNGYPPCLSWKGSCCTSHFISSNIFIPSVETSELPQILGSQIFITDACVPQSLSAVLSTPSLGPLVVGHFQEAIAHHADIVPSCLEKMVHLIYRYLNKQADVSSLLKTLPHWIYIKGKFVSPEVVAVESNNSFSQDLSPYVHTLPDSLASQYQDLFARCGVQKTLTRRQICSVLEMMHRSGGSEVSPERAWQIVMSILNWLTSNGEEMAQLDEGETLFVPIECDSKAPRLEDFTKVTYSDNEFLCNALSAAGQEVQYIFLNHRVTSLAHCLHISPLSDHLSITEDAFEDAGQHEPLTVRLKNILKEYKDGLTIIKEMLQNADDAGATELNICYDARTHTTERKALFFPDMVDSHGPALLVHNNSTFTDDDFRNITKLAGATKEGATLKIGKFGVGFCSVYHITDVPSFISRDCLHIFDPTLKYLKGAVKDITKPGKKLNLANPILRSSKQLQPYEGLFGFNRQQCFNGTMFRLPFRTSPSEISSTMYSKYTIDEMVSDLKQCSSELILFLRHIAKITFCSIEADSSTPHVLVEIEKTSQQCGGNSLSTITTRENGGSSSSKVWLVSTSEESTSQKQRTSSVACSLKMQDGRYYVQRCIGETFCFLPLSNSTGLPVHVSANFAVMTNRRGIWSEDSHTSHSTTESQWNIRLMESVIPKAYYSMLMGLKGLEQEGKLTGYVFHSLWPLKKELEQHHPWTACIAALYEMISAGELMYSSTTSQWLSIKDSRFIAPAIFALSSAHPDTPPCIVEAIEGLCIPVVDLPLEYRKNLKLEQSTITERVFIELFFSGIGLLQSMQDCRNAVLVTLLEVFAVEIGKGTEQERTLKVALEGHSCVPCSPNGAALKKCCELVDPQSEFAAMFEDTEGMFPSSDCRSELTKQAMLKLGLHHDSIPWEFIIERAQTISSLYKLDHDKALRRVQCILQSIHKNLVQCRGRVVPEKARELASVPFLPVKQKPERYPLSWFGDSCPHPLCGRDLVSYAEKNTSAYYDVDLVVGSTAAILQQNIADGAVMHVPMDVCNLLQIKTIPSCTDVVTHLKHLIDAVQQFESDITPSVHDICEAIYKFFDAFLGTRGQPTTSVEELKALRCIWTGKTFVHSNMIAKNWALDGPYLFKVPGILVHRIRLVGFLSIQSDFTIKDIMQALREMSNDFGDASVSKECQRVINHIIPLLQVNGTEGIDQTVMLPDKGYVLCNASQLAFNDTPWCEADEGTRYLHDNIPRPLALKLGVRTVRNLVIEKYTSLFEYTDTEGFGQSEPLTRRIQNILQDYPCDETVLKELLQNADDAKANKMYIILDKRTHGEKVFNDGWKDLQGPALLVWNNSIFSENDLKGIQKLGFGGKRSDAETIGQYGIGFNVVYHLTDCPSFVSNGDTMCIFDPHCKYAPGANTLKPGKRFDKLDDGFWKKFPDLKSAYLREGIEECSQDIQAELKGGSLLRFPLRHNEKMVRKSKIVPDEPDGTKPQPLDVKKMQKWLNKWATCMKQSMFFLNNVTEIKFFVIEEGSHQLDVTHYFSTTVKQDYRSELDKFRRASIDFRHGSVPKTVTYPLCLCEIQYQQVQTQSKGAAKVLKKVEEKWLIQQGMGDLENQSQKWTFIKQMKPRHGIAAPLDANNTQEGQLYCFLPLPIMSHLPVHINGHFTLNTARRDLWKSTDPTRATPDDPKITWNKNLMQAIMSSYYLFLINAYHHTCQLQSYISYDQMRGDLVTYYRLFPDLTSDKLEGIWLDLAKNVYKMLIQRNPHILAVTDHEMPGQLFLPDDDDDDDDEGVADQQTTPTLSVKWCSLQSSIPREQVHFFDHEQRPNMALPVVQSSMVETYSFPDITILPPRNTLATQPQTSQHPMLQSAVCQMTNILSILEMTGMLITHAPASIRENFSSCGLALAKISPRVVYDYYKKIHSQERTFPCDIEKSVFKTISNLKCFLEYILVLNDQKRYFVEPSFPDGMPLVLTADEKIRKFDSTVLIFACNFCHLFPSSTHHRFLHPDLLSLKMAPCYFLNAHRHMDTSFYHKNLHALLSNTLPEEMQGVQVDSDILDNGLLKSLWKCFTKDAVFQSCLDTIVERWAVLPSSCKQLFSTRSSVLPIVRPSLDDKLVTLLHSLGMPLLEEWVPSDAHRFCPQIKQHSKVLQSLASLHKKSPIEISPDSVSVLLRYFCSIDLVAEPQCVEQIRSMPFFQDTSGNWIELGHRKAYICPQDIEADGINECLHRSGAVLLDRHGVWRTFFKPSDLAVHEIKLEELFTEYVFDNFSSLSEQQRYSHLKYIRDVWLTVAIAQSFISKLKVLKCLGPDHSQLRAISDFCDHTQSIFSLSPELFSFLPEYFRSGDGEEEQWLKFFRKLGLKVCTTETDFELFTEYVFDNFSSLSEQQRYSHLKHIRDVWLTVAFTQSFISKLKVLKCLGPDHSQLRAISDFCDHTQTIFSLSPELFSFLPEYFRSGGGEEEQWLKFFRKLGLKVCMTETDFEQLVQKVVKGQYNDIKRTSNVLVQFLFDNHHKFKSDFLHRISDIPFVPVKELKHLTWIAPAFNAPHILQRGKQTIKMTRLRGAYCGEDECLIWTVMPVISLPSTCASEQVLQTLGVITKPGVQDVLRNVTSISNSPMSSETLFEQASQDKRVPLGCTNLISVMLAVFEFFQDTTEPPVRSLEALACIPVYSLLQQCIVLVKPMQVVITDDVSGYYPFLHQLPDQMRNSNLGIFKKIGISNNVGPEHMKIVLEMAYNQSDTLSLDINTKKMVHTALRTLCTLLKKTKGINAQSLAPLYLPDQRGKLCQSTLLVYCDNVQYSHKVLDFSRAGLSIFLLPPQLGIQEEEFCSLLPEAVRPKCISKCITKVRHANPLEVDSPIVTQIQQTLRMPELIDAIVKVIEHLTGNTDDAENLHRDFNAVLSTIEVITVRNLSHSISINQPPCSIGTIDLTYELVEEFGRCQLYVDSNKDSMVTCKLVCDALSGLAVKHLQSLLRYHIHDVLLQLKEYISTLLMAQRLEDIQEVLKTLNLRLGTREASSNDLEPKLGDPIPLTCHNRIARAPNNIFRPQEWVGYNIEGETIVFAQVIKSIDSSRCRIQMAADNVIGIIVSSASIYKFLRGSAHPATASMTTELIPTQPRALNFQEAMTQVHNELARIWNLNERERRMSRRNLLLEWHPDKYPDDKDLAEEVFKYLNQQLDRMREGLPLQDPPTE